MAMLISPQVFQVLLSLADGPQHGYAIVRDIRERTNDEVRLTASTLYDALARLVDQSLIQELDAPPDRADHDARRRYYQLTRLGRQAAEAEAKRLERVLEMAREKRLLPEDRTRGRR
jgi:DNA-binding PadR family transcriptional regulator